MQAWLASGYTVCTVKLVIRSCRILSVVTCHSTFLSFGVAVRRGLWLLCVTLAYAKGRLAGGCDCGV